VTTQASSSPATSAAGAVAAAVASARTPSPEQGPGLAVATQVVLRQQLARARVARVPLLFVASFQSIGILLLLRGVVDEGSTTTRQQVVAGATVLVVAFVALNLLAQRFGAMRAAGALDYYGTLPVPPAAVVLGTAAAYAAFAVPGTVVTAVVGALLYDLPLGRLWILAPVALLAGASLAGVGALMGLLAPKPELATVGGQLGMSVVLFLGIIPGSRLPVVVRALRAAVPSTYATDALARTLRPDVRWTDVGIDLLVCLAVAVLSLALGGWALRRATRR